MQNINFFIITALLMFCGACGVVKPEGVRLEYGPGWKISGTRDFRFTAGYYSLPRRETNKEIEDSLRELLAREMEKNNEVCPGGYNVTRTGASEGGGYLFIEGICL